MLPPLDGEPQGRVLPLTWVDAFMDYSESISSPEIFRKWTAIATLAGALERKVWVRTRGSNLYPNLYTILVGPPGVGKTATLDVAHRFFGKLPEHHIAPSSVSAASMIDALADAKRNILRPNEDPNFVEFNSLMIAANELGVFMPAWDSDFMNRLTDLYDGKKYSERRRTRELKLTIENPQLNLIAATTPSYINSLMPEGAWDQGFISRVVMVYSGENEPRSLFQEATRDEALEKALLSDLKYIGNKLYGKMGFTPDAAKFLENWHMQKGPPAPEHPKLVHYNSRRTAHLIKLMMIACAARTDDLLISDVDFQVGLSWLLEAELTMPDIFRSMAAGGDMKAMDDLWFFAYQIFMRQPENNRKPVMESTLVTFLSERVPSHSVMRVIDLMVKSNRFKQGIDGLGRPCYTPLAKREL